MTKRRVAEPASKWLTIRVTSREHAALTESGKFLKQSANDLMREALEQAYPEIFGPDASLAVNMSHDPQSDASSV